MSLSPAVIDALVAAGATVEQLAAAVKADMAEEAARRAEKREKDAARQRKSRSNRRVSRNVTVTPRDSADAPPNDIYSNPPRSPNEISNEISSPSLRPEHVVEAWNDMAGRCGLPKAKLTPDRRRKLVSRIRKTAIEDWTEAINAVERSPFCRGENDRGWRANIDFLLQPSSFTRLTEGTYDGSTS